MGHIQEEFQQVCDGIVSTNIIRKEARQLGINGRAAAYKLMVTKFNNAARLTWGKEWRQSTVEQ